MFARTRLWFVGAILFVAVNIGGAVMAAREDELMHAGGHVTLALIGILFALRMLSRWRAEGPVAVVDAPSTAPRSEMDGHLTYLEQSLDAVAIEVERIGEGQRVITQMFGEQGARDAQTQASTKSVD